ncbi:anti-sigma factor, partial [Cellulomonas bogoriensis 69B4 = DSM 16987]
SAATAVPASSGGRAATADQAGRPSAEQVLGWLRDEGWACPVALPDGMHVTAVHERPPGRLEVDLLGTYGVVVVTQERGRLDHDALAVLGARSTEIEGRTLHLLSSSPWHAVWQADDTVVSVVAERHTPEVEALVAAHPHGGYDEGIPARIARGWKTVAGAWNP